jgi:hypothetical protein
MAFSNYVMSLLSGDGAAFLEFYFYVRLLRCVPAAPRASLIAFVNCAENTVPTQRTLILHLLGTTEVRRCECGFSFLLRG